MLERRSISTSRHPRCEDGGYAMVLYSSGIVAWIRDPCACLLRASSKLTNIMGRAGRVWRRRPVWMDYYFGCAPPGGS